MATLHISFEAIVKVVRWAARSLATLFAGFVLVFFLAHVIGTLTGQDDGGPVEIREIPRIASFTALWLGLVLGWKWELFGGLLTLSGLIAFYLLSYTLFGTWPTQAAFVILASPGVLYLFYGWAGRRKPGSSVPSPRGEGEE